MKHHDFRSDTVTLPTPAMMAAIASARLGDAARGDDAAVRELETLACTLTGKDDALLLPTGTMANLAALVAHECRGGEVVVEQDAHVYNAEGGGLSAVAGAIARPVAGERGIMTADSVREALRGSEDPSRAPTRLVCLENTHNVGGGSVYPLSTLAEIRAVAQRAAVPVHLDGARLFNAAANLGVTIDRVCEHVDSVWFSLCKGLRNPMGAMLAGDAPFIRKARRAAWMLGGRMHQAGLIAAPALVALRDPYRAHERDHALARRLAAGLAAIDDTLVAPEHVQTNIVNCFVGQFVSDGRAIVRALRVRGVLALGRGTRIRFVTHAQVNEASVLAAVDAIGAIVRALRRRA